MRWRWLVSVIMLGLITWLLVATDAVNALGVEVPSLKRFKFPDVHIEAVVDSDGHMRVVETRQWEFRGAYTWVEQWIDHPEAVTIRDVTIGEPGRPYEAGSGDTFGTYRVEERGGGTAIRWRFDAKDETRTFILSYTAHNAVRAHTDTAELYWQFIGDDWEVPTDKAIVQLQLPAGAGRLQAWGHGPLQGRVMPGPGDTVTWEVTEMRPGRMLEGRVLFDLAAVPGAARQTGIAMVADILAEEAGWAAEADLARNVARIDLLIAIAAAPLGLFMLFVFWRRHSRDPKPDWSGAYYRELPDDYSPGDLAMLLHRDVKKKLGSALSATMLDLGRRGHLTLALTAGKGWRGNDLAIRPGPAADDGNLLPHEERLLEFLNEAASLPGELTVANLRRWMRKHQSETRAFVANWLEHLQERREQLGFWAEESGRWFRRFLILGAGGTMALLWTQPLLLYWSKYTLWPIAIGAGWLGLGRYRRSQYGADQLARWRGFKRFLLHFSRLDLAEVPAVVLWEHYLVFATVLGVAAKVLKQMKDVLPRLPEEHRLTDTSMLFTDRATAVFDTSRLEALGNLTAMTEQSFTSALRTATESSSSGDGGGFSGGGGGGDGGGGGRAG